LSLPNRDEVELGCDNENHKRLDVAGRRHLNYNK
jgi:hypothetical protein